MILLDTHVLLWMDLDHHAMGRSTHRTVQAAWSAARVAVSAISFWECAMLHEKGRLRLPDTLQAWRAELLSAGLVELPLDGETAVLAVALDLPHKDPADRFIVAAAIKHKATLVTADDRLLKWKHALKRQDATK